MIVFISYLVNDLGVLVVKQSAEQGQGAEPHFLLDVQNVHHLGNARSDVQHARHLLDVVLGAAQSVVLHGEPVQACPANPVLNSL